MMYPVAYFWLVVYLLRGAHSFTLTIEDAGLKPWNVDDIALILYLTVSNKANHIVEDVFVNGDNCCLEKDESGPNNECPIFKVLGDSTPRINPGSSVNFSLIIPTIYPYGRHGDCVVKVNFDSEYFMQHQVHFDTRLFEPTKEHLPKRVQDAVLGLPICDSLDEDPVHDCKPIKCVLKYGSNRAYFNHRTRLCEKPPRCSSTPENPLIFSMKTSSCKDEELKLGSRHVPLGMDTSHTIVWEEFDLLKKYKLICVHGDRTSQGCECDFGWTTSTDGRSAFDAEEMVYKMCNTQSEDYVDSLRPTSLVATLVSTSLLGLILLITLLTITHRHGRYVVKKLSQVSLNTLRFTLDKKENDEGLHKDVYAIAKVINAQQPDLEGYLHLDIGDILSNLEKSDEPGIWMGTTNNERGKFRIECVEYYVPTHQIPND